MIWPEFNFRRDAMDLFLLVMHLSDIIIDLTQDKSADSTVA